MLSWKLLLERLQAAADEFAIQADIHQLHGLMQRLNDEAIPPLPAQMAAPDFRSRDDRRRRMVCDLVARGWRAGWASLQDQSWGHTPSFHRRFLSFPGTPPP